MKIPLSQITTGNRQRKDFGDISELAQSLKENGQMQNIGVSAQADGSLLLVWGMRRYLAAKSLGWTEIEAKVEANMSPEREQELEYEEDIRRKDRSWQERCIAVAKLFRMKERSAQRVGETWSVRKMSDFTGMDRSTIAQYIGIMSDALEAPQRDEELWNASNYSAGIEILRSRREREAHQELERRQQIRNASLALKFVLDPTTGMSSVPLPLISTPAFSQSSSDVRKPDTTLFLPNISCRANLFNTIYNHLWKQQLRIMINPSDPSDQFLVGYWFVGGGNVSDFYGSYQTEYLERIKTLFPDKKKVVHLFSGSLPPSPDYTRVGMDPTGQYKSDLEIDVHNLSSHLPFKPDLIYADPPYSVEDSEHYQNSMVNRERVVQECALVLEPGGFLVWLDQALPTFSNNDLQLVGFISYIRSTGNRFRVVSLFRKPLCQTIPSPSPTASEFS